LGVHEGVRVSKGMSSRQERSILVYIITFQLINTLKICDSFSSARQQYSTLGIQRGIKPSLFPKVVDIPVGEMCAGKL
jgi:hypothetical protein